MGHFIHSSSCAHQGKEALGPRDVSQRVPQGVGAHVHPVVVPSHPMDLIQDR